MKISLRIISLLLSLLLVLSLFACKADEVVEGATETEEITETEKATKKRSTTARTEKATMAPVLQTVPEMDLPDGIKNIILIIGDGMGQEHIKAAQAYYGETYAFTEWYQTLCDTDSLTSKGKENSATDSAAAATALATGVLTYNKYVGKNSYGWDYLTILDVAKTVDKSVGIVTSDYLYGATPAGFSAHSTDRENRSQITLSQTESGVDFMLGLRNDAVYKGVYDPYLTKNGYFFSSDMSDTSQIMAAEKAFLTVDIENGKENSVELKDAATLAIDFLEKDTDGFVLMIEQAYIDKYSHNNKIEGMLDRVNSLNKTVEAVMEWVGDRTDTAVIITADHETGGFSFATEEGVYEELFDEEGGTPIYYQWTSVNHTDSLVNAFVYGIEFNFSTISEFKTDEKIKNTDIFKLMYGLIGAPQ